jgi:hypothetical protein
LSFTVSVAASVPALTSLSPTSGAAGSVITLIGANLAGVTVVNFGSTPAINVSCTSTGTSCVATVPALPAGPYGVTAVSSDGTSTSSTLSFTITSGTTPPPTNGITVATVAGWNLVGGPTGTVATGSIGPLYTFQAGDTAYEVVPTGTALTAPRGYWAYFNAPGTMTLPVVSLQTQTVTLPASQWVMIGNPGNTPATVTGADTVYSYNPAITTGSPYTATTTLLPGQGAWAISISGGTATVANR